MVDTIPPPEFSGVTDRNWKVITPYLPHDENGKVAVGKTRHGINPEIAKEQIHDAMKRCKKSSGTRHLDPLMKKGFAEKVTNLAVADMIGARTVKKKSGGRWNIYENYYASKLGWAKRKIFRVAELGRIRMPKRKRKRRL